MQGVYLPLFNDNSAWPDKVKRDFTNQLHKFMAFLTDTTFQLKGYTILYVPREDLSNTAEIAKSKDHVQRLESLLVHWTRQVCPGVQTFDGMGHMVAYTIHTLRITFADQRSHQQPAHLRKYGE